MTPHHVALLIVFCAIFGVGPGCAREMPRGISSHAADSFPDPMARDLAECAERGDTEGMARLVANGANVNYAGKLGVTPAWWAICMGNKQGFQWLLEHGANPSPEVQTFMIMEFAASYADSEFLEIALRHKPDLNMVSKGNGSTTLNTAVAHTRRRNVELLIAAGADLNQERGELPVIFAAGQGRYDFVYLMLQAGADPAKIIHDGPNRGQNDLAYTISHSYINLEGEGYEWRERVIRFLRSKGIEAHPPPNEGKRTKPLPPDLR